MSDAAGSAPAATIADASTDLVKNLLLGAQAASAALAAIATRHDLTVDDWLILDALDAADGLAMSEISRQTLASGASLTRAVDRLVTRSLVYRTPGAVDRRKVEVRISTLGRERHAAMRDEVHVLDAALHALLDTAGTEPAAVLGRVASDI